MADTNSDQAPAQSTIGAVAPPAEDEVHVFPPWGTGSEPSIPTVDTEDNDVRLHARSLLHGDSTYRNPRAELSLTEHR
jgi:hypothetical protein